ncbi:LysR family transcriptional regulator [Aquabacterium sp. OR-4]|uniref:LysR family transcriptional regulator n=1 Tax=Aquabacterium sp. OR-4 TaxID=2978127 RepID=UPI0021B4BF45|nr:LysR family transcriptional regulator [Aquabacterium sp. OR-4]MDT7837914.1 LysR family transcriptional regulator [Aquabacterium sp. OR-4]
MDISKVDLNLLVSFDAMAEHRSVTRAGEAIGLSQPAMSAALNRLRALFGDALFVKTGSHMEPTLRAQALAPHVRRVVETVKTEILNSAEFDPATSERIFTLITPDIGEIHFVPPLLAYLAQAAPHLRLRVVSRPRLAASEALASGAADLALGYFPDLDSAEFFRQKLFDNHHVCVVRRGHPGVGDGEAPLSVDAYLAMRHVLVKPDGRAHVFEQYLQQQGLRRDVALEISHFMSLPPIIEASDLIATVPRDLADICSRYAELRIFETPVKAPVIPVHQFWHRRAHKDSATMWLRSSIQKLFAV